MRLEPLGNLTLQAATSDRPIRPPGASDAGQAHLVPMRRSRLFLGCREEPRKLVMATCYAFQAIDSMSSRIPTCSRPFLLKLVALKPEDPKDQVEGWSLSQTRKVSPGPNLKVTPLNQKISKTVVSFLWSSLMHPNFKRYSDHLVCSKFGIYLYIYIFNMRHHTTKERSQNCHCHNWDPGKKKKICLRVTIPQKKHKKITR